MLFTKMEKVWGNVIGNAKTILILSWGNYIWRFAMRREELDKYSSLPLAGDPEAIDSSFQKII